MTVRCLCNCLFHLSLSAWRERSVLTDVIVQLHLLEAWPRHLHHSDPLGFVGQYHTHTHGLGLSKGSSFVPWLLPEHMGFIMKTKIYRSKCWVDIKKKDWWSMPCSLCFPGRYINVFDTAISDLSWCAQSVATLAGLVEFDSASSSLFRAGKNIWWHILSICLHSSFRTVTILEVSRHTYSREYTDLLWVTRTWHTNTELYLY